MQSMHYLNLIVRLKREKYTQLIRYRKHSWRSGLTRRITNPFPIGSAGSNPAECARIHSSIGLEQSPAER